MVSLYITLVAVFHGCTSDDTALNRLGDDPLSSGLHQDSLKVAIKNASELSNFYALLVLRDGEMVIEEYFKGKSAQDLFHLRSITKNITSAVAGIAIHEGVVDSLDAKISNYYPDILMGDKAVITIRHLLNMSSGLEWNENTEIIGLLEHDIVNPVDNFLSRNLVAPPGRVFNYNTVSPHVVADIIDLKTNLSYQLYTKEKLLEPLQIDRYLWDTDPDGRVWGGVGLQLTARDLVKFGQLYLDNGIWEGTQLVSEEWIKLSSPAQIDRPNSETGYSLYWYTADCLEPSIYFGQGFGGQALILIPEEKMIIIGLQEYLVSLEQSDRQWRNFQENVFRPVYGAIKRD
jgi:CubicO group peptidase (beta-lactamase class C family)